jgi:hypothetical protein
VYEVAYFSIPTDRGLRAVARRGTATFQGSDEEVFAGDVEKVYRSAISAVYKASHVRRCLRCESGAAGNFDRRVDSRFDSIADSMRR